MTSQSYVSKELTHFVGRRLAEDERYDEQYELLIRILQEGWLKADPENRNKVYPWPTEDTFVLNIESITEDVSQPAFKPHAVCFCDIPVEDLGIHMNKYGNFGLSFLKSYLVQKGASPVYYCAKNSKVISTFHDSRDTYFQQEFERYMNKQYGAEEISTSDRVAFHEFFGFYVFGFIKFFDDAAGEKDANNFYMEREWRVLGNVRFELGDVYRVIMPERYAERVRQDLPDYSAHLTHP
jgi:abortive phage resistance protein AbiGi (putative antitoxin)